MNIPGYSIDRLISEGGMASVYLAEQQSLGRQVALKVLRKFDNQVQSERFLNEGKTIASMHHQNIVTIYDIGVFEQQHYIAMEYLPGGSLEDRIKQGIPEQAALDMVISIGRCLDFVHQHGVVHRDIKPANILFQQDGTLKLTDFGLAKDLIIDQNITMDGTALGSPYYLSPEQAEGKTADVRSDLYSLGIIFYEMLTGQKPYAGTSAIETILAHLNEPIPDLPEELAGYQKIIDRLLQKQAERRFSSAGEMLGYLHAIRDGSQQHVTAKSFFPITSSWGNDAIGLGGLMIVATLLLVSLQGTSKDVMQSSIAQEKQPEDKARITASENMDALVKRLETPANKPDALNISPLQNLLQQGDEALAASKLTTPQKESALHYYTQALAEDPSNAQAQKGITHIADNYAVMINSALQKGQKSLAKEYLNRGLKVQSNHAGLLKIQKRLNKKTSIKKQPKSWYNNIFDKITSVF